MSMIQKSIEPLNMPKESFIHVGDRVVSEAYGYGTADAVDGMHVIVSFDNDERTFRDVPWWMISFVSKEATP